MAKKLYGNNIRKACEVCAHGRRSADGSECRFVARRRRDIPQKNLSYKKNPDPYGSGFFLVIIV